MIFYLETLSFITHPINNDRTLMIFLCVRLSVCYQRVSMLISDGESVEVKYMSNKINVNEITNRKIEKKFQHPI